MFTIPQGYKQLNAYIATQGPLQNTVEDFWRMVWEFKCRVILMLCPLTEKGRESSYCYWPTEEEMAVSYGSISVMLQSQLLYDGYEVRTFKIRHKSEDQDIVVTQLHYTEWPEHGRPPNTASMVELMDTLTRTQMSTGNKPIVVHCNDGVGRTGTFITMYSELERLKAEGEVDVFQRVKICRIARPGLVQNVGYKRLNTYIATQGPLQNTVEDFWRMVWEFKCRVIVMLCHLTEEGRESSYCYWPTKEGESMSYGKLVVTFQSVVAYDVFQMRRFKIKEEKNNCTHLCYEWKVLQ